MAQDNSNNNRSALYSLITVWFFWGFSAASNGVFIPFCKTHFHLSQFESQLIDFTFYGGYFIGSLVLYFASQITRVDILNKIGYKNAIVIGLLISVAGALLMVPAINAGVFGFILGAFFIIAIGFSLQQTAVNPFIVALGPPETGATRLNLAGGVNNFGSILGPVVVSFLLFGSASSNSNAVVSISSVNNLYIILAVLFFILAVFFWKTTLPKVTSDEKIEQSTKANLPLFVIFIAFCLILAATPLSNATHLSPAYFVYGALFLIVGTLITSSSKATKQKEGWGAMKYPQLIYGMIGIFVYVGVEVTIDNNFGALLRTPGYLTELGLDESKISKYVSLYWGSLMIGRWTGAIGVFNLSEMGKKIATIVVPFVAFAIVLFVNHLYGSDISNLLPYAIFVAIAIAAFFYGQEKPVKTLLTVSILATVFMLTGVFTNGILSVYCFMAGGLCCSIMWPCIFSLGVGGLGKYTSQGSAFLIMMILGGAVIPPFQGSVGDAFSMHHSYLVAAACFAFLAWLALKLKTVLKAQGLNFDEQIGGGH